MFKITKITKEEAFKIIKTKEPLGLFWLIDGDTFIAIVNSTEYVLVEEFKDKEECLQCKRSNVSKYSTIFTIQCLMEL